MRTLIGGHVGNDELAQFRREFEERARGADSLARSKDLRRQQLDAESQARSEEVVRLIESIGTALTRPPLPYVRFKVLHRFDSQEGVSPRASWAAELEWTGAGRRRSLRLEVTRADSMLRWYWSAGDDHQVEESLAVESVSEESIKSLVAAITDGEIFDGGQLPQAPGSRERTSERRAPRRNHRTRVAATVLGV